MMIQHPKTLTIADGSDTGIVRPSDWNSGHAMALSLGGNTSNASSWSGTSGLVLAGGNNMTLAISAGSLLFHAEAQSVQPVAVSAPNGSFVFSTLALVQTNGVTWQTSTDGLRASVKTDYLTTAAPSNHSHGNPSLQLTNLSGTTGSNSAGFTLSLSAGNYLTTAALSNHSHGFSASGGSSAFQTLSFDNANGITFSNQAGAVRISHELQYTSNTSAIITGRAGTGTTFAGANISGSMTNNTAGLNLSLSVAAPGGGGGVALYDGANSITSGTARFSNANGISVGINGQTITLSHNGLTTAALSNHSHGNPSLQLTNLSGTTGSNSAGLTLSLSAAAQSVQTQNLHNVTISGNTAGAGAAISSGTLTLAGGNNITLSQNGNAITISGGAAGGADGINALVVNGGVSTASTTLTLSNSNGVSFGLAGGVITASHNGLTTAALSNHSHAFSASGGSSAFQTLSFDNANGVTFSNQAGAVRIAHELQHTSNTSAIITGRAGTGTTFAGINVSGSMTNNTDGLNLSLSVANPGGPAPVAIADSNVTVSSGTLFLTNWDSRTTATSFTSTLFYNAPVMLTINGNALYGHHAGLTRISAQNTDASIVGNSLRFQGAGIITCNYQFGSVLYVSGEAIRGISAGTASHSGGTIVFSNSNGISFGLNASTITASHNGLTTAALSNHSHGNPSLQLTNLSGTTGSNSAGFTLSLSAAAPGAAAEANWFHLIGNTSNASTASGSTISLSAGNNVTLAGSNGSIIKIEAAAGGGGDPATFWWPFNEGVNVMGQQGNATLQFVPIPTPAVGQNVQFDRIAMPFYFSNATGSSGTVTLSGWMGFYTKNESTLSLLHSTSFNSTMSYTGTSLSASQHGIRLLTIPWTTTVTEGRYYVGIMTRTSTGGNNCSLSQILLSQMNTHFSGQWNAPLNRSRQWPPGLGVLSASTTTLPGSVAFSQIDGTASLAARPPSWFAISGSV